MRKAEIEAEIVAFISDWNRRDWMSEHGTWASEDWESERSEYEDAHSEVEVAFNDLTVDATFGADNTVGAEIARLHAALDRLESAHKALDGQVRPDEFSDYISEGTIDPDNVEGGAVSLDIGESWQGWDCTEGWGAYRSDDALVMNWWRSASGQRHQRDLWVVVDEDFFS